MSTNGSAPAANGTNGVKKTVNIPSVKLSGKGTEMPLVGFGLWKVTNETCADQVYNAIKTGYRLLDGACDYGNEKEAGEGVARAIKDGLVTRDELFITSKLWGTYLAQEHVEPMCQKSLDDWGLEYFDLYLIHFPISLKYVDPAVRYPPGWGFESADGEVVPSRAPLHLTWAGMEAIQAKGMAKEIGISNYAGALILDCLRYCNVRPAVLQVELHPYLTQDRLIELCQQEGIAVTGYSSFGPASFIELGWDKASSAVPLFKNPVVVAAASRAGKTPAQVLLRWSTQRGIAVVPKSNSQNRLEENLDCCGFDLTEDELKQITALNYNLRFNNPVDYLKKMAIFS